MLLVSWQRIDIVANASDLFRVYPVMSMTTKSTLFTRCLSIDSMKAVSLFETAIRLMNDPPSFQRLSISLRGGASVDGGSSGSCGGG
jgi:hypothetical protein